MNLKTFDLERALAGDPVITRDGQSIKIISANSDHPTHKVIGEKIGDYGHFALRWRHDGTYTTGNEEVDLDLFMVPVKRQEWVNIYEDDNESRFNNSSRYKLGANVWATQHDAENNICGGGYIRSIMIKEWEE